MEDTVAVAENLSLALNAGGFDTCVTLTGREGLRQAADFHPDIVLIDLTLPDIDGYNVARELRSAGRAPCPMLVALSGRPSDDQEGARLFDHQLVKPVRLATLLSLFAPYRQA